MRPLSAGAFDALRTIITQGGATVLPAHRVALARRGLVRMPHWNQLNYCRATDAGRSLYAQRTVDAAADRTIARLEASA